MHICLLIPWGHLLGKGCPFGSRFLCLSVTLSLSTWLYGFLIFVLFLTMTMFYKSRIYTVWFHLQGRGGGMGSEGMIFATMLLHTWFHLIWYATWPCEKVEFWPFDPPLLSTGGGGGWGKSVGKIFATMLLHSLFHLIWYATWPCSEKTGFWSFAPTYLLPCCCIRKSI